MSNLEENELTGLIIGAAIEVHRILDSGHAGSVVSCQQEHHGSDRPISAGSVTETSVTNIGESQGRATISTEARSANWILLQIQKMPGIGPTDSVPIWRPRNASPPSPDQSEKFGYMSINIVWTRSQFGGWIVKHPADPRLPFQPR